AGGWSGCPRPGLDGRPAAPAPDPPRDRRARHLERSAALFLAAAQEAWRDAGLGDEGAAVSDPARWGVIEGSSLGPLADALETLRARLATGDAAPRPSGLLRFMTGAGGAALAHCPRRRGPVPHVSAVRVTAAAR